MIRRKCWTAAICLGVTLLLGGDGLSAAEPVTKPSDGARAKREAEGWKQITEEVFERRLGPNKVEHLGFGREGLSWAIGEMNRRLEHLREEQERYPSEELSQIIDDLTARIAEATTELGKLEQNEEQSMSSVTDAVTGPSCSSICYSATADAYPLTSSQGVGAVAEAKCNSTCGYSGDAYAYAYARATEGTVTTANLQEDPRTGTNVTSSASASAYGGLDCFSEAYSSVSNSALGIYYDTSDSNYSCPAPFDVTMSGPSSINFTSATCSTYTWSASVSGGTTPYSYKWYYNGTEVGTGSSYSRSVCYNHADFTIQAAVTDSSSPVQSESVSQAVDVVPPLDVAMSGPSSANFTTATCSTYTWSASVSGGTTPYSYKWYYNGTQVGTGTSYSRSVCYNHADFTIQVSVTDSSSPLQSKSVSRAVDVTYVPPFAVTMSGPSSMDFTTATCSTYTWSASASGGTAPYAYKWYYNGTQVGTGTSYSRSVCYNHADFTIQVTVTDSSSPLQSKSVSRAVDVTYVLAVTMSGPSSAYFTSATCSTKTWSASVSGGTTPYSYKWYYNGTQVGTGTSYSRNVCYNHADFTIQATVTDNSSPVQSKSVSQAVDVIYDSGPVCECGACNGQICP